ncbi:hypothetical protein BKA81DRAFT_912 [Phyllosticta paracitricarpa]
MLSLFFSMSEVMGLRMESSLPDEDFRHCKLQQRRYLNNFRSSILQQNGVQCNAWLSSYEGTTAYLAPEAASTPHDPRPNGQIHRLTGSLMAQKRLQVKKYHAARPRGDKLITIPKRRCNRRGYPASSAVEVTPQDWGRRVFGNGFSSNSSILSIEIPCGNERLTLVLEIVE